MATDSIPSGGAFTLSLPLASGTNIDFLNAAAASGTLFIEPAAFEVATITASGTASISGVGLGGTIENFRPGDTIDLQFIDTVFGALDVAATASSANTAFDNDIKFNAESTVTYFIAPDGTATSSVNSPVSKVDANTQTIFDDIRTGLFGATANGVTLTLTPVLRGSVSDVLVTASGVVNPCFAAGTRILTVQGEVAVEHLAAGDRVITYDGEEQEIIWVGQRVLDVSRHARPESVRPVVVEMGALAENVPARRLIVSPDHAFYIDRVLVPAKALVNGITIRQDGNARMVRYYHVELPVHGIIFAEGAAAESYLDTGHRGVFDNQAAAMLLHPDLMQIRREAEGCAPLCTGGEILAAIRARLALRCHGQAKRLG